MLNRTLTFISVFFLSITLLFIALWVHRLQNRDPQGNWTAGEKYGYATIDIQSLDKNLKRLKGKQNANKQKIKELEKELKLAKRKQELNINEKQKLQESLEVLEAEIAQIKNFIEAVILSDSNNR